MSSIPGVPNLLNAGAVLSFAGNVLTQDVLSYASLGYSAQWGIFKGGSSVVTATNVVSVDYKKESVLSNYPIEGGGFESYDKVAVPYEARVRFSAGGSQSNRAALIASVAAIDGDLKFYDVVTPEKVYSSCNVTHQDLKRTATNGVGLVQIDVWLTEVRVNSTSPNLANALSPASVSPTVGGAPQTTAPNASDTANIDSSGYTAGLELGASEAATLNVPQLNAADVSAAGGIP